MTNKPYLIALGAVLALSLSSCFPVGLISRAIQASDTGWSTSLQLFQDAVHNLDYDSINEVLAAPYYTPLQLERLKKITSSDNAQSQEIKAAFKAIQFNITRTTQPNGSSAVGVYVTYILKALPREVAMVVTKDQSGAWKIMPNRIFAGLPQGQAIFALLGMRPESPDVIDLLDTAHKELNLPLN